MAQNKRKPGAFTSTKRRHLENIYKNEKGEYEYKGPEFRFCGDSSAYKKYVASLWLFSLGCFVLQIVCGCIPVKSMMNTFYVIVPYVVGIVFTVICIYHIPSVTVKDGRIREYIYKKNTNIITVSSLSCAAFCFLTAVGETVFVFINGLYSGGIYDVLSVVICSAAAILAISVRNIMKSSKWELITRG